MRRGPSKRVGVIVAALGCAVAIIVLISGGDPRVRASPKIPRLHLPAGPLAGRVSENVTARVLLGGKRCRVKTAQSSGCVLRGRSSRGKPGFSRLAVAFVAPRPTDGTQSFYEVAYSLSCGGMGLAVPVRERIALRQTVRITPPLVSQCSGRGSGLVVYVSRSPGTAVSDTELDRVLTTGAPLPAGETLVGTFSFATAPA
jgi:hypothetical protein